MGTLVAFLLIAGGFAYYLLTDNPEDTVVITRVDASPLEATLGRTLLSTLVRLKSTTIDMSVFSDPVFTSLHDFGVIIASQPVGRRNPFAPLGAGVSGATEGSLPPVIPQGTPDTTSQPTAPQEEGDEGFSGFDL